MERDWTDFVNARRFALEQVETPWVLMIDADEALDDVLRDAIGSAAENVNAYVVRRTTYFCGHPMRIWSNEPLVRLFRRDRVKLTARPAAAGEAPIHEAWTSDGPTSELPGTLLHYSYPDAAAYRSKYDRYTTLEAQQMHASPAGLAMAGGTGLLRLVWLLLAKAALLDGPRGWYVAYRSAFYPAVAMRKALWKR